MGYIKISDPNILDLNAIHNIINVVNQHSDTLNILTNNYGSLGSTTPPNYAAAEMTALFDTASQQIVYGRTTFTSTDSYEYYYASGGSSTLANSTQANTTSNPPGYYYYKTVTFASGTPSFGTTSPLIYLTVHTGNSSTFSPVFADATARVYSPLSNSFKIGLFMQEPIGSNQVIHINWMAIGPKNS